MKFMATMNAHFRTLQYKSMRIKSWVYMENFITPLQKHKNLGLNLLIKEDMPLKLWDFEVISTCILRLINSVKK